MSIFQQHGNQRLDGSFVYNAVSTLEKGIILKFCRKVSYFENYNAKIYSFPLEILSSCFIVVGVSVPGKVRIFDEKGEIMVESKFPTGINYQQAEYEGGIGIHETGNRGTRIGLNM